MRIINTVDAVREAHELLLAESPNNIIIGEGVPDPKCCFGTTRGLIEKFANQVFDSPVSENGIAGVCIGASLHGIKPIFIHMRQDFLLYAMDQIVNNAAKWCSMFGGNGGNVPIVIKAFTGRGWGSGHQHSQNLESIFAHIPGLKVLVPSSPRTAKGLLIAAAHDPNPCIILEDRWIHHLEGDVPEGMYETPIGKAEIVKYGTRAKDSYKGNCVITWGRMVAEALRAAEYIDLTVIDLLSLSPLDTDILVEWSGGRTLIVCESWERGGIGPYIQQIATWHEDEACLMPLPNFYPSSTPSLTKDYYPSWRSIVRHFNERIELPPDNLPHDIPDKSFTGPF